MIPFAIFLVLYAISIIVLGYMISFSPVLAFITFAIIGFIHTLNGLIQTIPLLVVTL